MDLRGDPTRATLPAQVRLSEILIATPQPHDEAQVSQAEQRAREIREAIGRGEKFEDLARANSQGPSAMQGGDLGYFASGHLAPALENLVFTMKVGETSEVNRTRQGFVILRVTERIEQGKAPLEVLNTPITRELSPYLQEMMKKIRERWYATIPYSARGSRKKQGNVAIRFVVHNDGKIADETIASSSGEHSLDEAAFKAVNQANPFPAFPTDVKAPQLVLLFHFAYNPPEGPGPH